MLQPLYSFEFHRKIFTLELDVFVDELRFKVSLKPTRASQLSNLGIKIGSRPMQRALVCSAIA